MHVNQGTMTRNGPCNKITKLMEGEKTIHKN